MTAGVARRAIGMLDLTSLGNETDPEIAQLCERAVTPAGPVAAVCVNPDRVARCVGELDGRVAVAAVANFPKGDLDATLALADSADALEAGADEIDLVLPWRAWLAGEREDAIGVVGLVRMMSPGVLKVIIESGSLGSPESVREAAADVLDAGADFVKTSTGRRKPGATPAAARAILEAVRDAGHGGLKVAGGIRTAADAANYLALADELMGPDWAAPGVFRIGASGLLEELLEQL